MSTVALAIGLVVGNISTPARACSSPTTLRKAAEAEAAKGGESDTVDFLLGIIPTTLVSAFTEGEVLQTLLVALLVGFALQAMGERARRSCAASGTSSGSSSASSP